MKSETKITNKIVNIIFLVTLLSTSLFVINTVLAEVETYNFVVKWGTLGSNNGQFNYPCDVAVDNNGYVYVLDVGNNRVQKFTNNGTFIMQWGSYGSNNGQFNYSYYSTTSNQTLISTAGITTDNLGNVYVADPNNDRIQKFNSNGTFLTKFNAHGSIDVAVDQTGNLYIPNYSNTHIQKFNSNGDWLASFNASYNPTFYKFMSIAVDNAGYIYVLDNVWQTGNGVVLRFDSNGVIQKNWNVGVYELPQESPTGLAVDSAGFVYVVGVGAGMQYSGLNSSDAELVTGINKYNSSGKIVTRWGNPGTGEVWSASGDGEFNYPRGVAVDNLGNVFVADTGNNRIQKFTKIPDVVIPEFSSSIVLLMPIMIASSFAFALKGKQTKQLSFSQKCTRLNTKVKKD